MDLPENNYQPKFHPYYREFTKQATSTIIMLAISTLFMLGAIWYTTASSAPTAILGSSTTP
jgi:hypothetical protein